jgi:hypothetical protein
MWHGACPVRGMPRGPLSLFICVCAVWASFPVSAFASVSTEELQKQVLPSRVIGTGDLELSFPDVASWEQRLAEMRQWIGDYGKWKQWNGTWRNKREPGWVHARDRRVRPDPPAWLGAECADVVFQDNDIVADACRLWTDWNEDQRVTEVRQQLAAARTQHEAPTKTVWWEHVHFDALWPMTQWKGSVYGVLGMHATVEVAGRLQVFVAPGVILLNLPNGANDRQWRPATDWGMAYRLFDFTIPGSERRASLHVNLAKAWIFAGPGNAVKSSIDLAGFSVTLKKPR